MFSQQTGPIGIFDSGYGGLTVFDTMHVLRMGNVRLKLFTGLRVRRC